MADTEFLLLYRQLVTDNQVEMKYCLTSKMENIEVEESRIEYNGTELNGRFEDCNAMLKITPISHVKVANFI